MTADAWATLRVELARPGDEEQAMIWALALEGLAACVAEEPDVGAVETRDPTTLGGALRPELWIYTIPTALERVRSRVELLAPRFGLPLRLTADIREDDDWRYAWRRFFQPQVFGTGEHALLLRPSWIERRPDDPLRELVLDPGHAFGTGLHESTRLCLRQLCTLAAALGPNTRIADLGCGSGILAIAAACLVPGASILAADIDPDATETTKDNARRNAVHERIETLTGGATDLPHGTQFDLVLANIRPVVLVPLAATTRSHLAPGAQVLLSGIYGDEHDGVRKAWLEAGLVERAHEVDGDWSLLQMQAPQ